MPVLRRHHVLWKPPTLGPFCVFMDVLRVCVNGCQQSDGTVFLRSPWKPALGEYHVFTESIDASTQTAPCLYGVHGSQHSDGMFLRGRWIPVLRQFQVLMKPMNAATRTDLGQTLLLRSVVLHIYKMPLGRHWGGGHDPYWPRDNPTEGSRFITRFSIPLQAS